MPLEQLRFRPSLSNTRLENQEEIKRTFTNETINDIIRVPRAVVGDLRINTRGICLAFAHFNGLNLTAFVIHTTFITYILLTYY